MLFLLVFWLGGMVSACGHIAIEFRRGLDFQTALIAHNHPFVYSLCLMAGVIAWPVMLLLIWERSDPHRSDDDDDDDDDDDGDSGDPDGREPVPA
jgi:hypothetical protein